MHWAILTPERCVRWDGHALVFGPGADRASAPPADAAESLWLTYYASIFNPARLKLAMMKKEMPRRYWKNLPEAALIEPLSATAHELSAQMVEQAPVEPLRRRPASSASLAIATRPVKIHAPGSLAELRDATQRCRECPIGASATQAVNGEGNENARLMLVGEQPGDREDLEGRPFVGPAGQLLDRAFLQLGWPRDQLYLTNAVKHFKFVLSGQRRIHKTPAQKEAEACLHWLERELALVAPAAVVALGATAARALLGHAVAPVKERGRWFVRADGLRVMVTLHPAALLRMDPAERPRAFQDWLVDLAGASAELVR
jgi:uracil-DNA glycosylase family protein